MLHDYIEFDGSFGIEDLQALLKKSLEWFLNQGGAEASYWLKRADVVDRGVDDVMKEVIEDFQKDPTDVGWSVGSVVLREYIRAHWEWKELPEERTFYGFSSWTHDDGFVVEIMELD